MKTPTATATDSAATATGPTPLAVNTGGMTCSGGVCELLSSLVNDFYLTSFGAVGDTAPPFTWAVAGGTVPPGLTLVDFHALQKLETYRLVKGTAQTPSIEGGEVMVANEEPLKRELADFVDAIAANRPPRVDGAQGRRALALAQQITDRMTATT